jgi:hypothetical protein
MSARAFLVVVAVVALIVAVAYMHRPRAAGPAAASALHGGR